MATACFRVRRQVIMVFLSTGFREGCGFGKSYKLTHLYTGICLDGSSHLKVAVLKIDLALRLV